MTMHKFLMNSIIFALGGCAYGLIEIFWRGYTHLSMIFAGGFCFLMIYLIYSRFPNLSILLKALIGSAVITSTEFFLGLILNYKLHLDIWDYSELRFNLFGQISLLYSLLWAVLSALISPICTAINKHSAKLTIQHSTIPKKTADK